MRRPLREEQPDTVQILDAIRRIVQALRVASREADRRFGMSAAQLFVVQRLAEGGAASLNDLAARTLTHQSSVSVVVQRLVDAGLVERSPSPRDGRRVVLELTAKGRALARRLPQAAQDRLIDAVETLSPAERRVLADLLARVAAECTPATTPAMFFEDAQVTRRRNPNGRR
jgi:DNA-binding MarR family transcriptional regulator